MAPLLLTSAAGCFGDDSGSTTLYGGFTSLDASVLDVGLPDAAQPDASLLDAGQHDAALPDASVPDVGLPDVSQADQAAGNAVVSLSAAAQDFGTIQVNQQSAPFTLTVTNTGNATSGAIATSVTGAGAQAFVVDTDACNGQTLAAGGSCAVTLHFAPSQAGPLAATWKAVADPGGVAMASLSGTGMAQVPAAFSVTPATYDFGASTTGVSTSAQTFTVTNTGGLPSGAPSVANSGANAADFAVASNGCTAPLAHGATCTFSVTFTPGAPASGTSSSESATITISAPSTASVSATLTGTALAAAALAIAPGSQDFQSATQGTATADVPFVVTNNGGSTSGTLAVSLTGTYKDQFQLGTDTCTGATLAAGGSASCTVNVHFAPTASATGLVQATLTVWGTPGGTAVATLTGTSTTPSAIAFPAAPYPCGSIVDTQSSAPVTITLTNGGGSRSGPLQAPVVAGANPGDFAVATNGCTGTLDPGKSCDLTVVFTPQSTVAESATVSIAATPGGTAVATLQGTGTPALSITPATLDYGDVTQGSHSTKTFVFTNAGAVAASPTVNLTGSDFVLVTNGCTSSVAANGGTCSIDVAFAPTDTMPHSGALTATASAPNESPSATLTGLGAVPALTVDKPSYSFPGTALNTTSTATFTVSNTGAGDTGLLSVTATQPSAAFTVPAANDTCSGHPLTAGNKCSFELQFAPRAAGEFGLNRNGAIPGTGPFVVITDGTYTARVSIPSAPGIVQGQPFLVLEPNPLDFDSYTAKTQTISIGNYGTVAASGVGGIAWNGGAPGNFTMAVGTTNPCVSANGLAAFTSAPAANCTWQASFTPPATAPPQLVTARYLVRTSTGTNEPTGTLSGTP